MTWLPIKRGAQCVSPRIVPDDACKRTGESNYAIAGYLADPVPSDLKIQVVGFGFGV
jgi:hypothetical protein